MPVRRFRDVSEMDDERWLEPGSSELSAAIRSVWDFAARTCPRDFPPGVHRHASMQSLYATEESWQQADFEKLWDQRGDLWSLVSGKRQLR